jgi:hypothetical protein
VVIRLSCTSMTRLSTWNDADDKLQTIVSLVESRGTATEVGFASLDLQSSECIVGQFADTLTFAGLCRQLVILQPDTVGPSNSD